MTKVYIIAEAGVNHNGDEALAYQLIDKAVDAGADAVKFQTFKAEDIASHEAKKATYQIDSNQPEQTQFEMLKALELSHSLHFKLKEYAQDVGIDFLSTAFDLTSLNFLVHQLKVDRLKIPSGEITNLPFILAHAQTGLDVILSTGMATLSEIEQALSTLAFGLLNKGQKPKSQMCFNQAYLSPQGQKLLKDKVTILHCTSEYPTPIEHVNLNALDLMRQKFTSKLGYSDHTQGIYVSLAAVAKGATIIEKHFTLDKTLPGPDHKASLSPQELKQMISGVRQVEHSLGQAIKQPSIGEQETKIIARKSLALKVSVRKGEELTEENLTTLRPSTGICPSLYWQYLGTNAKQNYQPGDLLHE
ncbi:N-acetylneuraminate synthase [Psychrobium sp. 1_MG-2023]|uniref:N-acetylneuraminate synthase n=1 Tax=Psychrobium sp. 1_MG-2023 TaxID=3062624 RepID=UPI000C346C6C|nr:N-acetylneuraminate synthase [Psychrobium sp. 1_MG-2023]MDP2559848.1 N-acetylneuraminate synthase [Psychrobium sp. 1_MG-2023]PKF59048.1 N-acetylneuraminate synthase [Alteromonadales bacterium alter-6D02]